jgi:electron transfer flavoprotein alpha subunit
MKPHIIIIGEHADNNIAPATFELIAFAKILQHHTHTGIHLFLAGSRLTDAANRLAETEGIDITLMEPDVSAISTGTKPAPIDLVFKNLPVELILRLNPVYVCMGHTPTGTDVAPALAISLNAACITGVERLVTRGNDLCFVRSVFNDKITAAMLPTAKVTVLTMMPGSFKPEPTLPGKSGTVSIRNICINASIDASTDNSTDNSDDRCGYAFHGFKKNDADTSALNNAEVIVSAGNGVKKQEHLVPNISQIRCGRFPADL